MESRQNISQAHACLNFNSTQSFSSGSVVKNLTATQETQVQSLGQDNPLQEGVATHFSILVRKILWTEEPVRPHTVHGVTESDTTEVTEHVKETLAALKYFQCLSHSMFPLLFFPLSDLMRFLELP